MVVSLLCPKRLQWLKNRRIRYSGSHNRRVNRCICTRSLTCSGVSTFWGTRSSSVRN